ncbi:MAG: ShlB/FhaC/HecB family hemolysin secretion/activation protein, partial [Leptolyngbya sp. SIO1D8]|nr:ShlB/FhaC/HecB family hemolysin secretion/activation protein [Leptolyngbya sp. SIO1D8]
ERNLTGIGDGLTLGYNLTEGSQDVDFAYTLPINPYNGTLSFALGYTGSEVLESPFEILEVTSNATVAELTLRQPLIQTPTQELALGLIASRQGTQTFLGIADIGGFPLSAGANDEGRIAVTALRFFQEWSQRSPNRVIALRSQFNLGLDALGSTVNSGDIPDSQFFSWLGQGQWVQLLGPDTPLLLRGSIQLTPDPLLTLERYGLGGQATVRGYSQDEVLTDNGANLSLEVRLPVWRSRNSDGLLQVTPFIEGGVGWNTQEAAPDSNSLFSVGAGLLLQVENLDVRADFGIPLIDTGGDDDTLQEQGIYFSLGYSFF